jgi:hypothetical protein
MIMIRKRRRIMEKITECLKNNKTVNLIKTAFISFILLLSSIPLSTLADVNTDVNINPAVTPGNIYNFDAESGLAGWQTDGLWHVTTNRYNSPGHSLWYGDETTKTYNTGGANSGNLMSPPITLAGGSQPVLDFWSWYQTEHNKKYYDIKLVQISVNDGSWTDLLKITDAPRTWNKETIDLSGYAGNTIRLRFLFDTVDDKLNDFEGWYVDDIQITSDAISTATPASTPASTVITTAPADTNLIANPGFETGTITPMNWNFVAHNENTPAWDATTSHSGTKSVKISISGTNDIISGDVWSDFIPATSGITYTFSAWGKSQGAGGTNNPAVRVAEFDINHAWLRQTSLYFPKGDADWNQQQTTFTTGDGTAYIGMYANIWNGYGTFWVDDVSLTDPGTIPTPAPSATQAPTSTPTPTPTQAPESTPTATPDPTPAPTASPDPTPAPTATPDPTPAPTASPDPTPAPTATPDPTPAPTVAPTVTPASAPAPASGSGPTYYVATNGNDGNSGSSSSPWRTIQHAADSVSAGATVYVMGGTYNEKVTMKNSGSSGNYITFAAYPGQTVTIDGTGISLNYDGLIRMDGVSYIKISGFHIVHSTFMGVMISGGASNIIVQNNYINDISSSALLAQDASYITYDGNEVTNAQTMKGLGGQTNENVNIIRTNNFEIKNNHVYNNPNFESIDVKEGSSYGSIHHNDISGVHSAGIYIDAQGKNSQNIDIYQNKVHDSQESGARGIAIGVESSGSAKNMRVYDNVVWGMGAIGIVAGTSYSAGAVDNIAVVNNVVYNNGLADSWGGGIKIEYSSATNMRIRNNIASQNRNTQIDNAAGGNAAVTNNLVDGSGGTTGDSSVTGSPQFVDPSNGNFHIQSTSPAIDKGTSTDAPNVDFDGNSRPKGAGYDIGAFEY